MSYCITKELRDQQIEHSLTRTKNRLAVQSEIRSAPIALVGFGPSLLDTWKEVELFYWVMTCSGAHKFFAEKGSSPQFHCLSGGSIVETEGGPRTMRSLFESQYSGSVYSLDSCGKFRLNKVLECTRQSSRNTDTKWVEVNFSARGNKSKYAMHRRT